MDISRIKQLQQWSKGESLDLNDIAEIERAFHQLPVNELRDLPENAMVDDMLEELEAHVSTVERVIFDYIVENFGESEALEPSWAIGPLADHLNKELNLI